MNSRERVRVHIDGEMIVAAGISDPGRIRSENQDSIYLDKDGHFLLLADGMGGHERGAEASSIVLDVIQEYLQPDLISAELKEITNVEDMPAKVICLFSLVDKGISRANSKLFEINRKEGLERYMGATVVGLIPVESDNILWFHVGDSRIYRWRDSTLKSLTSDHSAYAQWVRNGQSGNEPAKNIVTRAVGPKEGVVPDIKWDESRQGDIYILCSDGLTDMVSDEKMSDILRSRKDVDDISEMMIEEANNAGGKDNISVIICRIL
ncbi:MAG: serine/threonine-protein phosphatase [Deltaproteobacteria bacterium]|nr:serine/threonine-protein phosphatase [Deltaproteobacteria bacterium]